MVISWRARAFATGTNAFVYNRTLPCRPEEPYHQEVHPPLQVQHSMEPKPGTIPSAPAHDGAKNFHMAELLCSLPQTLLTQFLWSSHCLVIQAGAIRKINRELPSLAQTTFAIFFAFQDDFSTLMEQEAGTGTGMLCRGRGVPNPG